MEDAADITGCEALSAASDAIGGDGGEGLLASSTKEDRPEFGKEMRGDAAENVQSS